MRLTDVELSAIRQALVNAFPSESELAIFISDSMNESLDSVASPGNPSQAVFKCLRRAEATGQLETLLAQAVEARPKNSALRDLVKRLGLGHSIGTSNQRTSGASGGKRSYRFRESTLSLEFGDITSSTAQVLVSSDDYYLSMGGGVSRAILRAGGQSIALEAAKAAPAALGDVVVTAAGQLPARHVFHAVTIGPDHDSVDARAILTRIIPRCFQLVDALGLWSLAFPAIGAGVARFPLEEVAAVMAELIVSEIERRSSQLDITIYLMDRFGQAGPQDYIPFFEYFATRVPRVAAHAISEGAVPPTVESAPTRILATTAEQVRAQRFHQIYSLLAQLDEHRYRRELLLVQMSMSSASQERTTIEKQLTENEEIKKRFLAELDDMNRANGSGTSLVALKVQTVFVSSTYSDLKDHRAAVKDQITKRGLLFKGMELFGADPAKTPATLIVEEVNQADAFVGIVGARYGFIDGATGLSMTELEFNAARAAGKPMLLYVLDDKALVPHIDIEKSAEGTTKLYALRTQIMREHVVAKFTSVDHLAAQVYADLGKLTR